MSKDYARRNLNTTRAPKNKRWRIELLCLVFACVTVSAIAAWVILHKKYPSLLENPRFTSYLMQLKAIIHPEKNNQAMLAAQANEASRINPVPEVHFDFYTELPHRQVMTAAEGEKSLLKSVPKMVEPLSTSKPGKGKEKESTNQFVLQLGFFKNELDASQLRLSLLLGGCEAEIVKVNSNEGDGYRVQRGPFAVMSEAKSLQRKLQKQGISSDLKKI